MKLPESRVFLVCWLVSAALSIAHAELMLSNFDSSRPLKIMPIGDSITDDCSLNGAWRLYLQPLLQANGYPFEFVGRQASFPVLPSFTSVNHEGHCGAVIGPPGVFAIHGYNTNDAYLLKIVADALATNAQPDLILCMAGVNDIGRGRDPYQVVHRDLAGLVDLMFSNAPKVHIILAKITSLQDAVLPDLNYGGYATNVPIFNAELQSMVNARRALGEKVFMADMFSAVDYGTMFLPDHVHPNSSGLRMIANEWMARINSIAVRTNQFVSTVIHGGDRWNYCDAGVDLGTNWAQPDFDDTGWSNGVARFGYGDPTVVTSVDYGPDPANKHITTYFRKQFAVPGYLRATNLNFRLARADGLALWLNGAKVLRLNLPSEPITYTNLALTAMTGYSSQVFLPRYLPLPALHTGTNLLGVELHLSSVTNTTLGFDMELLASGFLLPGPSLSIRENAGSMILSWPAADAPSFTLYSNTNLTDPRAWIPAGASAATNGNQLVVTQAVTGTALFYRLQAQ